MALCTENVDGTTDSLLFKAASSRPGPSASGTVSGDAGIGAALVEIVGELEGLRILASQPFVTTRQAGIVEREGVAVGPE